MHYTHPLARTRFTHRLGTVALAAGLAFAVAACSSAASEDVGSGVGATTSALSGSAAVSRAEQWANAALPYCQSPYGQVDPDDACWSQPWESSHRCYRTSNAAWNPYRSDCSGLVSWAWALPAPGRTTYGFAPFQTDITHAITASALQPGDAVNNSDHVMLFKAWVTPGARAIFIEEPGCSTAVKHAQEITSNVSISGTTIHVDYVGMTFTAIRYVGIGSGGGAGESTGSTGSDDCVVGGLYCGGDKVTGDASTLYRCTGGSSGTVVENCANGCSVNAGSDDSCNAGGASAGSGDCAVGGLYCGGDKVTGDASTLYRCTGGSSGTVVESCANGCSVNAGRDDSCNAGGSTGSGDCTEGGLYCGGDKVSGDAGTLYRCTGGSGVAIATCSDGCEVRAGQDDACSGSGGCVVGGDYCGGDKVTGDPGTLYRCTGGSTGAVIAHCANGCEVRSGTNDACL